MTPANLVDALGAAANDRALSDDPNSARPENWIRISPYGEFPNINGLQVCDRTAAERMIKHFNSLPGRVGRLFRGLPIYVGHPDFSAGVDDYPDKTVYGHLNALEARADGLYGKPDWTDAGKAMVNEKDFLYPSPYWRMEPLSDRAGAFRPIRLVSVGLTNNPNIQGDPLPAQNARPTTNSLIATMQLSDFLKLISVPADADDARITARLTQLTSDAAARTAAEGHLAAANARADSAEQARNAGLVTSAINDGRIIAADRPAWEQALAHDFAAGSHDLAALRPALNTIPRVAALGTRRDEMALDVAGIAAINDAVNREMRDSGETDRNKVWSALKQKQPELFHQTQASVN